MKTEQERKGRRWKEKGKGKVRQGSREGWWGSQGFYCFILYISDAKMVTKTPPSPHFATSYYPIHLKWAKQGILLLYRYHTV
jgi:hypothetical protein